MRFLSNEECAEWCRQHGYRIISSSPGPFAPALEQPSFHRIEYQLPTDSGEKVALARSLLLRFVDSPEILVWNRNWDVWPSSGHVPLVDRLRRALGESRPLHEAPGFLATNVEHPDTLSFLIISLQFFWDCWLLSSDGSQAAFCSHDEFFAFMNRSESVVESFKISL
jgi:hypothetical protein